MTYRSKVIHTVLCSTRKKRENGAKAIFKEIMNGRYNFSKTET